MNDTGFTISEDNLPRLTKLYQGISRNVYKPVDPPLGAIDNSTVWLEGHPQSKRNAGGGGMLSTGHDYMRFAEWLTGKGVLEGKPCVLGKELLEAAVLDQLDIVGAAAGPCFDPYQSFGLLGGVVTSPGEPGKYLPGGSASGLGSTGW